MPQRLALAALLAAIAPATAFAQPAPARDNIDSLIELHARANKVPAAFVHRVVKRESNYNPRAKGGSALGLMQIKHATARGMGYGGDASGLYDPDTNLKFGIAYLAGAYRAAKGDLDQAYRYYNRGYYYAAKKLGITTEIAEVDTPQLAPQPVATSSTGFASLFGTTTAQPAAAAPASSTALAYAAPATTSTVEVPLPPRRPAALGSSEAMAVVMAEPVPSPATTSTVPPVPQATPAAVAPAAVASTTDEAVEVPLPPRRPSIVALAAVGRPIMVARKPDVPAPIQEATAAPGQ